MIPCCLWPSNTLRWGLTKSRSNIPILLGGREVKNKNLIQLTTFPVLQTEHYHELKQKGAAGALYGDTRGETEVTQRKSGSHLGR